MIGAMSVVGGLLTVAARHLSGYERTEQECEPTLPSSQVSEASASVPSYLRQQIFGATSGNSSAAENSQGTHRNSKQKDNHDDLSGTKANFTMDFLKKLLVHIKKDGQRAFDECDVERIQETTTLLQLTSDIIKSREAMEDAQTSGDMNAVVTLSTQVQKLQEELNQKLSKQSIDDDDMGESNNSRSDDMGHSRSARATRHSGNPKAQKANRGTLFSRLKRAVRGESDGSGSGVQTRNQKRAKRTDRSDIVYQRDDARLPKRQQRLQKSSSQTKMNTGHQQPRWISTRRSAPGRERSQNSNVASNNNRYRKNDADEADNESVSEDENSVDNTKRKKRHHSESEDDDDETDVSVNLLDDTPARAAVDSRQMVTPSPSRRVTNRNGSQESVRPLRVPSMRSGGYHFSGTTNGQSSEVVDIDSDTDIGNGGHGHDSEDDDMSKSSRNAARKKGKGTDDLDEEEAESPSLRWTDDSVLEHGRFVKDTDGRNYYIAIEDETVENVVEKMKDEFGENFGGGDDCGGSQRSSNKTNTNINTGSSSSNDYDACHGAMIECNNLRYDKRSLKNLKSELIGGTILVVPPDTWPNVPLESWPNILE